MKALKDYTIQFVSLKQGTHHFEFSVDNKFFEQLDCDDFIDSNFKVELEFIKQSTMMLLNFSFKGEIIVPCDRCLEDLKMPIKGEDKLIVKFGDTSHNEVDDILILAESEHEINVAHYIYEFIELNIPFRRVHKEADCNAETIKRLNELEVNKTEEIDPRWSALKNINNN
ncbi:MAG: DUF177 domain-containing protein [Flavobacteriales bacterium]|nr:DUF177 domain-containing protein [Flavobacteriales bacterium]